MIRMVYVCSYDGNTCDKVIPKFDEEGYLIPESSNYKGILPEISSKNGWDVCSNCPRNYSMGCPHGILKCIDCTIDSIQLTK